MYKENNSIHFTSLVTDDNRDHRVWRHTISDLFDLKINVALNGTSIWHKGDEKVSILEIEGHGSDIHLKFGEWRRHQSTPGGSDSDTILDSVNAAGIGDWLGSNMKKPCVIILKGCNTGRGKGSNSFPQLLANHSGCTVYGTGGTSNQNQTFSNFIYYIEDPDNLYITTNNQFVSINKTYPCEDEIRRPSDVNRMYKFTPYKGH